MGVFSRFKDIISSNMNALLDKAEDPNKLIRLMVQEMEETLVELKSSCARTMATRKNLDREQDAVRQQVQRWDERARLAVDKGRDELAREALIEKNAFVRKADVLDEEAAHLDALVEQAREDISRLEDKLQAAREKQRLLLQRHARATQRKRAGDNLTRAESSDAVLRFDTFERRIERMESEAELAAPKQRGGLEDEFAFLEKEDSIEAELKAMKNEAAPQKPAGGKPAPKAAKNK